MNKLSCVSSGTSWASEMVMEAIVFDISLKTGSETRKLAMATGRQD